MGEKAPGGNEGERSFKDRVVDALGATASGSPGRHKLGRVGEALSARPIAEQPPQQAPQE